jgi:hypothetical protein
VTVTSPFGVLVSYSEANYTISLVGVDGRVISSQLSSAPPTITCANGASAYLPTPVSTSSSRVYFMDAQGTVRFLAPDGDTGRATSVPIGPARRSSFAVSPDDQRIAVVVIDLTANGATTRLYVEDLNGRGHHLDTFSDSGAYTLWATGWRGTGNLVVAKVPACVAGGSVFPLAVPGELHVVDPSTAVRRVTVGNVTGCLVVGPPSPAGAVCEDLNASPLNATVLSWTGSTVRSFAIDGPMGAYLSPDGKIVALVNLASTVTTFEGGKPIDVRVCGWIDDTHVFSGGDSLQQARVVDVTSGKVAPIPTTQGTCAGRIPGGL